MKDFYAFCNDLCVGGKQQVNILSEMIKHQGQENGSSGADAETDADSLVYPIQFSCAKILPYKCGNGDTKGIDNGPVNHVNFAVSRPCCHYIGTQGVDVGLDDNVGSRIHDRLKSCGQADLDNSKKHIRMDPDVF